MAFDTVAVANQLVTVLQGLSGMGTVQIGAPKLPGTRVCAYVTMGSQRPIRKATGLAGREARYFIDLAYRLDGDETTAETTLMGVVDAFVVALYADLTLAGTCEGIEIDTGLADEPEYRKRSDSEWREYPILITARQYDTFATNP